MTKVILSTNGVVSEIGYHYYDHPIETRYGEFPVISQVQEDENITFWTAKQRIDIGDELKWEYWMNL